MIGSSAPMILGKLPTASFDRVYADGPDVVVAGTFNPTGARHGRRRRLPGERPVGIRQRVRAR